MTVTAEAPDRQRMESLRGANVIRTKRRELKMDIGDRRCKVAAFILDPPWWLLTIEVYDLMIATPGYGRVKVNRILDELVLSPSSPLESLSLARRQVLAAEMGREVEESSSKGKGPTLQCRLALALANEIRLARAGLKKLIKLGEITVEFVLTEKPAEADSMTVYQLLTAQQRWGRIRTRKLLRKTRIKEKKLVKTLTERQRMALIEALAGHEVHDPFVDSLASAHRQQNAIAAMQAELTARSEENRRSIYERCESRAHVLSPQTAAAPSRARSRRQITEVTTVLA